MVMWNEIANEKDIQAFMTMVKWFHDSCINLSRAHVSDDYKMLTNLRSRMVFGFFLFMQILGKSWKL